MRRIAVVLVGLVVLALAFDAQARQTPSFEVASVKPNTERNAAFTFSPNPPDGVRFVNSTLESIVRWAYDLERFQMGSTPGWTREERFDIEAKAATPLTDPQRRAMLRSLLAERFQLKTHMEPREQTTYVMKRARADGSLGPGLTPRPDCQESPCQSPGIINQNRGLIQMKATTLDALAGGRLTAILGQIVRNESGLSGVFDVDLSWRPDTAAADVNDGRPSFFTAVEEQLGIKLVPERGMVDVLVIDSVERPTAN